MKKFLVDFGTQISIMLLSIFISVGIVGIIGFSSRLMAGF